jgi:hypothetical protein
LTELLNPQGSHRKGTIFLKHFLDTINHKNDFTTEKSKVKMEFGIGNINLCTNEDEDESKASGGRIDIYLKDDVGNIISIENKIYAIDQPAQVQRYCNHEKDKNTVYYLTLHGKNPTNISKLKLESGKDFHNISYKSDIIKWLELCLKEVPNFTALRESINQYILLIKKLTNTLDAKHEKELTDTMLDNLLESQYIVKNYEKALNIIRQNFRVALKKSLSNELDEDKYEVKMGASIDNAYAQIWVDIKGFKEPQLRFGIEPFSGIPISHEYLFIGILDQQSKSSNLLKQDNFIRLNESWSLHHFLLNDSQLHFNLRDFEMIRLIRDVKSEEFKTLVVTCTKQISEFVKTNSEYVIAQLKNIK